MIFASVIFYVEKFQCPDFSQHMSPACDSSIQRPLDKKWNMSWLQTLRWAATYGYVFRQLFNISAEDFLNTADDLARRGRLSSQSPCLFDMKIHTNTCTWHCIIYECEPICYYHCILFVEKGMTSTRSLLSSAAAFVSAEVQRVHGVPGRVHDSWTAHDLWWAVLQLLVPG